MRGWFVALLLTAVACGKNEKPPAPLEGPGSQEVGPSVKKPPADPNMPSEAKVLFANVCSQCHGLDGTGNGPAAASLNPKPRNYTDPVWQKSVTDDDIKAIIVGGGQAVGKSGMMPPNPNLKGRDDVLNELVAIIRGFGRGGDAAGSAATGSGSAAAGSAAAGSAAGSAQPSGSGQPK